jgi:hypothetical protein
MALTMVIVAVLLLAWRLYWQTSAGLTDGLGHPFGEDFLNFWSGGALASAGRAGEIYDMRAFHQFQVATVGHEIDLYHYSYPPVMLLLTLPLGLMSYPIAWALWTVLGWLAFALCVRRIVPRHWALYAAALPAVMISAAGGQNGCWTAAILACGLLLLRPRPVLAGLVLSLLIYKPQLGWLVPLALLAGGHRRAFVGMAAGSLFLLGSTLLAFGVGIWSAYLGQAEILRIVIVEEGTGTWHRMISAFVFVRHLGLSVATSYAVQAVVSLGVLVITIQVWRSEASDPIKYAVLLLGLLIASPYVSDYDLVVAGVAVAWLWPEADSRGRLALAVAVTAPLLVASLATWTGIAVGALLLWPAFAHAVATAAAVVRTPAVPSADHPSSAGTVSDRPA